MRGQIAVRVGLAATAERDWIAAHRLNAMAKRAIAADNRGDQEMRLLLEAKLSLGSAFAYWIMQIDHGY